MMRARMLASLHTLQQGCSRLKRSRRAHVTPVVPLHHPLYALAPCVHALTPDRVACRPQAVI
eukprot:355359-Chlamydomonas_euryale.AAC.6